MNQFIIEYLAQLQSIHSDADVERVYHWLWDRQQEIAQTAAAINDALHLADTFMLQPDLPCLTIGAREALLFLLVNPSWRPPPSVNTKEDAHCRQSSRHYVDFMFNYLIRAPDVIEEWLRYTSQMISFIPILRDGAARFGNPRGKVARWQAAHANRLVGHWQLFPFHSEKDGITRHMSRQHWLADCFHESVKAALRLQPEVLLVFSKQAYELLRNQILPTQSWTETPVGARLTPVYYTVCHGAERTTEVVAMRRQVISCPVKVFTNQQLFTAVNTLRAFYPSNPP